MRMMPGRSMSAWFRVTSSMLILASAGLTASADDAPKLRYEWKSGSVFAYDISITADRPDATDQLQGVVTYTVKNVADQQIDVTYTGNLGRKETPKAGQGGPGGRRIGPPGRSGGPRGPMFGSNTPTGLTLQTNEIRLTKTGELVSIKGTSQLPYLLGNLSQLPFESLSEEAKKSWTQESGATITEGGDRSRIPSPRFRDQEDANKKSTAGGEAVRYEIEKRDGQRVTLHRVSSLKSASSDGKTPQFDLALDGKLEFDTERGLTTSSESKGKLNVKVDTLSVEVPLTIKMRLLTEQERVQHEEQQKALREDRVAKAKELQAQQQAKLAAPLTAKERKDIIEALDSGRPGSVISTLMTLTKREPTEEDKEIAKAIQKHINSTNAGIRRTAADAWAKWSSLLVEADDKPKSTSDDKPKGRPR